jgi:ubiquinone/menaquinone biosynthesis C-methylase UbiE
MEGAREAERLERKTDPEVTRRHLDLAGIAPGMRVLDAGSGTGAVTRDIARRVGERGRAVALDLSLSRSLLGRRLAREAGCANLDFVTADAHEPPLADGTFDLVFSRFLFGYLRDPDACLGRLVRLVRPGGRVFVGEVDGHGLWHWPLPPAVAALLPRLEAMVGQAFDLHAGRKLYHRLRRAGLREVEVHVLPYHLYTDSFSEAQRLNWGLKLETLGRMGRRHMGAEAWDAFAAQYLAMLEDPDVLTYSVVIFAEGVRPA